METSMVACSNTLKPDDIALGSNPTEAQQYDLLPYFMHRFETDDSNYNNLIKELWKENQTQKALTKCWAHSKCSENNSFYFYL